MVADTRRHTPNTGQSGEMAYAADLKSAGGSLHRGGSSPPSGTRITVFNAPNRPFVLAPHYPFFCGIQGSEGRVLGGGGGSLGGNDGFAGGAGGGAPGKAGWSGWTGSGRQGGGGVDEAELDQPGGDCCAGATWCRGVGGMPAGRRRYAVASAAWLGLFISCVEPHTHSTDSESSSGRQFCATPPAP